MMNRAGRDDFMHEDDVKSPRINRHKPPAVLDLLFYMPLPCKTKPRSSTDHNRH